MKNKQLLIAAECGNVQRIHKFLNEDDGVSSVIADVDYQDNGGYTALMLACKNGHIVAVEALLNYFANVGLRNKLGGTALRIACKNGSTQIVNLLLQQVGIDTKDVSTALRIVCDCGWDEIFKLLLKHKDIDVNAKNNDGKTALMIASKYGHLEILELFDIFDKKTNCNL